MRPLLLLSLAGAVFAQGTTPREKPEDYPAHAQARSAVLGAEFRGRTYASGEQTYTARGFLVVEVALYPPPGQHVDVHSGNFVMYVNGRKQELLPQAPSVVSTSVAHPEWATSATVRPRTIVPQTPTQPGTPQQAVLATALPQGERGTPVSGYLFFSYTGRVPAIRSLELRYEDAILRLR